MKIAAITEDGISVSQHFGRAPLFLVITAEGGRITRHETRAKAGHATFAAHHPDTAQGERHGYDSGAQVRHASMMGTIVDCDVLIAGGMGWGAYEGLRNNNIEPIVTDIEVIEEAVRLYLDGKLENRMERLH